MLDFSRKYIPYIRFQETRIIISCVIALFSTCSQRLFNYASAFRDRAKTVKSRKHKRVFREPKREREFPNENGREKGRLDGREMISDADVGSASLVSHMGARDWTTQRRETHRGLCRSICSPPKIHTETYIHEYREPRGCAIQNAEIARTHRRGPAAAAALEGETARRIREKERREEG